jgi:hypothetical protein
VGGTESACRRHAATHEEGVFQPSYLWETSDHGRDINYLLLGVIFKTK